MKKLIFAAVIAVALPTLSLNANPGNTPEYGLLNNSEFSQDEDNSFSAIQRRRRRRRSRLRSPFGISAFAGTARTADGRNLAIGSEFDYAHKNSKKKYKAQLMACLYASLPVKSAFIASEENPDGTFTDYDATASTTNLALTVIGRYFIIGQVTSKFGMMFDLGLGYAFTPRKVEANSGSNSYSESPSDMIFQFGIGFGSNIGKMQLALTTGLYVPPNEKGGEVYVAKIDAWSYAKLSARFPIGR